MTSSMPESTQEHLDACPMTPCMCLAVVKNIAFANLGLRSASIDGQEDLFPETLEVPLRRSDSAKTG